MFLDEVTISVRGGNGGNGAISFHRAKYVPKGGPDGGNGGQGGSLIIQVDPNKNTLYHFKGIKEFLAKNGHNGSGQNCTGAAGEDTTLLVPPGTLVKDADTGAVLYDLTNIGEQYTAAKGGRGGKGNVNFTSSTRQAPRFAELGEPGQARRLHLELKLVGDVGIIGMPSVGKSTLISVISAARPKIAEYHFTTLVPNLGVVAHRGDSWVVTDMPGLIKGASKGKGLGIAFLKHAERVRCFVHLLAADADSPVTNYRTIRAELAKYSPKLAAIPEIVALSRIDLLTEDAAQKLAKKIAKACGHEPILLSAPIHTGLTQLLDAQLQQLQTMRASQPPAAPILPVFRPQTDPRSKSYTIVKKQGIWHITGPRLEQIVVMSDLKNPEAVARIHDVLHKFGIDRDLVRRGAVGGARLMIAGKALEWWGM